MGGPPAAQALACPIGALGHRPPAACLPTLHPRRAAAQVAVESSGDETTDAAVVEEKLLALRKGSAKLRVRLLRCAQPCLRLRLRLGLSTVHLPATRILACPHAHPTPHRCLQVVADRGLQRGDLAIVDFSAKRADNGEELVGATRSSMRIDTDDADRTFLPGGWWVGCVVWCGVLARS